MYDDYAPDISDQSAIDNAAKEAERREREDDETVRVWMSHPKGRDLLFRITREVCHMGRTFIALDQNGQTDTHRTFTDLGERNIGAWIDERMTRHPGLYNLMISEQQIERESRLEKIRKANEKAERDDV